MTKLKSPIEVICTDFPDIQIKEETRQTAIKTARTGRYAPIDARQAMGRFPADEKYEVYRRRVLETELP